MATPPPEKPFEPPDPGLPGMGRSEEVPEKPVPALAGHGLYAGCSLFN